MSDATQPEPPPQTSPLRSGLGWIAKYWPRIRLGHEGLMLEKIARQNRIVETLARNTMSGNMGDVTGWPGNAEEDAMGVNIGDHIHYHKAEPAPASPPVAESQLSKWLPYAVAAALAVGGYYLGRQSPTIPVVLRPTPAADKNSYGIELQHYIPVDHGGTNR